MDADRARRGLRVAEAAVLLVAFRVAVAVLPFRVLRRLMGTQAPATERPTGHRSAVPQAVHDAIEGAARRLPIGTACLPRALAGQAMLRRRGQRATVVFGLAKSDGTWLNHAWLEHGGAYVVGEQPTVDYTPTVAYVARGGVS